MTTLEAVILGLVQGATEFLPVSSSAHLVLLPEFFNIPAPSIAFDVILHLATLVAVAGYFVRDLVQMVLAFLAPRRLPSMEVRYWRRLFLWLVIGSIPAVAVGATLGDFVEGLFASTLATGAFLMVTACLLWGADAAVSFSARRFSGLESMRLSDALIVGCFQALALAPGISRSGATMSSAVFLGFDRETAARFSFLLSVPAILGAGVLKLGDIGDAFAGAEAGAYTLGAVAALVSGFLAVSMLLRFVRRHRFRAFGIYTFLLGAFVVALSLA